MFGLFWVVQITQVCAPQGLIFDYSTSNFEGQNRPLFAGQARFEILGKSLFSGSFCGRIFWGEKCPLSAGRVAFVILEVTQVTECSVFPNRALFTSLIQVNIGLVCRSSSQEFIGQSDLGRNGLVVLGIPNR
ncbi:hypothetical protein CYK25_009095 [Varibaculum cambriense]|nr:hypothetical protein CYK25_009095 [Varibaculum cambriense]